MQVTSHQNEPIQVPPDEFENYLAYFDTPRDLRLIIVSALLAKKGELWKIEAEDDLLLMYTAEVFVALYGDVSSVGSEKLLELAPIHRLILASEEWYTLARVQFKRRLIEKKDARFRFQNDELNMKNLESLEKRYIEKYDYSKVTFRLLQPDDTVPTAIWGGFDLFFASASELTLHGFAVVAINEQNEIISIAGVPHPIFNGEYEVQIATDPKYRKKGIGMRVAIKLLRYSLQQGISPRWDAATPLSANMAEKLGYTRREGYPMVVRTKLIVMILRASKVPKLIIWILRKLSVLKD